MPTVDQLCIAARAILGPGPDIGKYTNPFLRPHLQRALEILNTRLAHMGITTPSIVRYVNLPPNHNRLNLTAIGVGSAALISKIEWRPVGAPLTPLTWDFSAADPTIQNPTAPALAIRLTFSTPHNLSSNQRMVIYRTTGTQAPIEGEYPINVVDATTVDLLGAAGKLTDPLIAPIGEVAPVSRTPYPLYPISLYDAENRSQSSGPLGYYPTKDTILVTPSTQLIQFKISYQPVLDVNDNLPDNEIVVGFPGSEIYLADATAAWAAQATNHKLAGPITSRAYGSTSGEYAITKESSMMEALRVACKQAVESGQFPIDPLEFSPRPFHG